MFVTPKKKNKFVRPVFNLEQLNQYLVTTHFKMETIREVSLMINPEDYSVSIDLSDAFLHIGLHQIGIATGANSSSSITEIEMDREHQGVGFEFNAATRTSRVCFKYTQNDSDSAIKKALPHTAFNQADTGQALLLDSIGHPQLYYEDPGSHIHSVSGKPVYRASRVLQEPGGGEVGNRLGKASTLGQSQHKGSYLTIFVNASDTGWCCSLGKRQSHGCWTQQEEASQSINWRGLMTANLALESFPGFTELDNTDSDEQHSHSVVHQQKGRHSFATSSETSDQRLDLVSAPQHIQGKHNTIAERESRRIFSKNQWQILPAVFQQLS
ncbi:hypothetical protein [Parasitella parasitica]|uniref:Uncharacterized protein n=1 Tax=Parasitella parasitica TaxID=35722 RepID=A0A0B7NJ37_9FUNG|nr:hypothetical protein [Parasitella parasitica]